MKDIEKLIRDNIADVFHMSFSTSLDNKSWTVELHFAYDDRLNLYFVSLPTTRHCFEFTQNPIVSGSIVRQYDLTAKEPVGIYFEGNVKKLETSEKGLAFELLHERIGIPEDILHESSKKDGHQFYKVSISNWYAYGKFGGSHGQKIQLPWKSS